MKKFYLLLISCFCFLYSGFAQTLIDPVMGGGFDQGNTFALNGWTAVNSSANKWVVGSTTFNSSPNSAYISSNGNVANYNYDNTTAHISHFYQQVTIPANATNVILSFELKGNIENDVNFNLLDGLEIYTDASLTAPVPDALPGGSAVLQFIQFSPSATYVNQAFNINSLAGKTVLIIFTWINDAGGIGSGPPASVDDVKLTYCILNTNYTVSGGGGYCPGSPGANVGLPGSVVGINYQLYNNGIATGSPVPGTGSPIDFGPQTVGGPYTVKGTSGACSYNMLGSVSVSLFPPPSASAGSNTPLCSGATLNLTSSAGTTFNWTGPNSFASSVQSPSLTGVTTAASGAYTVTVTDANGCSAPATTNVVVNPVNTATLTSAAGTNAQAVCVNTLIAPVTYATTGATGATFSGLPSGVSGNWSSNTVTISGTPSVTGTFAYSVTLTGGCPATVNGSITVTTNSTITLTSAPGSDAQTRCINTAITDITYATTGATGATVSGLPAGVSGTWAANVVTISGTPTTTLGSPFNYTVTLTGGCGNITAIGSIAVTTGNTIALSSAAGTNAQTICVNTPITDISYSTTAATGATFSGLPAGVTGTWASNVVTISGTPTTVTGSPFTYTVTLTGGCGNITASGSITVTTGNTITLSSATGTNAQTVCVNTPIANITYATTAATGATFSGLPAGVTGIWASNVATISGTPTATTGSPFNYTVTLTGGCGTISAIGSIAVNRNNSITLSSAAGTNAQTTCINTAITGISYTTTGATGATFSGLPAGVSGSWAANVITIMGIPNTATGSPFNYTVTLTGGCGNITASGSITVNTQNTITLSSAAGTDAQTKCYQTAISPVTYTTTGATGAGFSGLPTGVSGSWAANTVTIGGIPTVTGTFNYTVTLTGGCGSITASGSITVTPDNTITLSSAPGTDVQTKCINTAIANITYATTGATGASFSGLPAGVTGSWASNMVTISGTPTTSTGSPFNYTVSLTGSCGNISAIGTITVTSLASLMLTSGVGTDAQTVCNGSLIAGITYAYNNVSGASVTGLPAGLSVLPGIGIITISGTPTQTGSFTYNITTTGGCGQATASGTIIIQPAVGGSVTSASICTGGGGSVMLSGQSGTITGWESSVDGASTWNSAGNANNTTLAFTGIIVPTLFRAVINNGCGNVYSTPGLVGIHNLWTGATNIDWNTASNWSDNQVPSSTCPDVYIPNTTNKPVLSNAPVAKIGNLNIYSGASLTVNAGGLLQIAGIITNQGSFDVTDGTLEFLGTSQSVSGSTFTAKTIKNLIVSSSGTGLSISNIPGDTLNILGTLSFGNAASDLSTGDNITLKSTASGTANVGVLTSGNVITGNVTVERYIATGPGSAPNHGKSWQLLAVPTQGQTIKQAWAEGATQSNVSFPAPGSTGNPVAGYGTMLTSDVAGAATQPMPGFDAYTSPGPSIKAYNYVAGNFIGPSGTGNGIYDKKGWYVFVRGDRSVYTFSMPANPTVLRTKGTLFTPANPPPSTTVMAGKFESIGNPYASAIDVKKLSLVGIDSVFIVWDPRLGGNYGYGAYQYIFKANPADPNSDYWVNPGGYSYPAFGTMYNYIQSGQAFLMQATGSNGTVSFSENAKSNSNPSIFTTPNSVPVIPGMLRTTLQAINTDGSTSLLDGIVSSFSDYYSNAIDGMDARKMVNTGENLAIRTAGKLLAIERKQPVTDKDTILLNLANVRVQAYRFHFDAENLDPGLEAFLEDKYLNSRTPINTSTSTDINFSIVNMAASYAADRFRIVFALQKALPVTFMLLKAYRQDKDIDVEWSVDNEMMIKQYEVEKSTDGNTFTTITVKKPSANNGGSAIYVIADISPFEGYNYYRIRSVDINGKVGYTNVVKVLMANLKPDIVIYPNPITDGIIHLQLVNQPKGRYGIRLLNKLGQVIIQMQINHSEGSSTESIKWDYNLAHGIYQLEVTRPDGHIKNINVLY